VTDYAHTNFDDIEPMGVEGIVEGRFARGHTGAQQVGVSRFRYEPGAKAPYGHRHGVQEETYVVVTGSGRMKLDEEVVDLKQWDIVRVAPAVARAIEAGPDGIEVIVAGGERPPEGDGEMIEDFWT
jgi:mannose-6-phosphate isomerase-like protein (cupin superfamily)